VYGDGIHASHMSGVRQRQILVDVGQGAGIDDGIGTSGLGRIEFDHLDGAGGRRRAERRVDIGGSGQDGQEFQALVARVEAVHTIGNRADSHAVGQGIMQLHGHTFDDYP